MFQFLKVIPLALMVLIFCFFNSALASDEGQKSHSQLSSGSKESRIVQLKTETVIVNPNIQIHPNSPTSQSEMSISTHPLNPNVVLVGSNATRTTPSIKSEGWYYTTDGGTNWLGNDTFPTHTNLSLSMHDPAVAIDLEGNLFFNAIYATPRNIVVDRSTDNGSTWTQVLVPNTTGDDKDHLAIDVNPASPWQNYLYTAFSRYIVSPFPIRFSRSTDRGLSFSTPIAISGSVTGLAGAVDVNLAVGPDGELYAGWQAWDEWPPDTLPMQLGFNKSTDGGATWQTAVSIRSVSIIPEFQNKGGGSFVMANTLSMAVDRSSAPRRGWIYLVYPEKDTMTKDIFLIRSTDGGSSWSSPQKVNQDTSGNDHWFPEIAVDPATGHLYVVYYDSRNFPANDSTQVYISSSADGGLTFEDVLVSDVPFLPAPIVGGIYSGYMGDYIGIAALNGMVWPCWNDNRTGIHQAYTSKVVYDSITIPAKINVSPDTLDFGDVVAATSETLCFFLRNLGYPETLLVTNIQSDDSNFTPEITSFSQPGGSSRKVKVTFNPSTCGLDSANLTISSSDTTNPTVTVHLLGNGLGLSKPGDANGSGGNPNLTDIIYLVNYIFKEGPAPAPVCRGDANASGGNANLTDIIYLVNYVFKEGSAPVKSGVCCL